MEMNIHKYLAFIKTIECGSFTKAAQLLNYSQSGISRMISDLENEWGVSLLERGRGGTRLTSEGLKLLPFAKKVCDDFFELQAQIDALNGLESGIIRIGTISSVATHWLPNIFREFRKDYPNIQYELLSGDYSEIEKWISEGRVDCGFTILPARAEFETIFLARDRMLAIIPENHSMSGCEKFPIAEICREPFMLLDKGGKSEVQELLENNKITPHVQFTTWDDYSIMAMVESGLGISILPELILKRAPYRIIAKELDIPAYRDIGLALKSRKNASLAVKKFIEYLSNQKFL